MAGGRAMTNGNDSYSGAPFHVYLTKPTEVLWHMISDEQLEMLAGSRRDGLLEALWGCIGLGGGSGIPAGAAFYAAYRPEPNLAIPFEDFLNIVVCVSAVVASIVIFCLWRRRGKTAGSIIDEIRNRARESR